MSEGSLASSLLPCIFPTYQPALVFVLLNQQHHSHMGLLLKLLILETHPVAGILSRNQACKMTKITTGEEYRIFLPCGSTFRSLQDFKEFRGSAVVLLLHFRPFDFTTLKHLFPSPPVFLLLLLFFLLLAAVLSVFICLSLYSLNNE